MTPSYCVLPWIHLATHPNGGVSLCCRSNHTNASSWAKQADSDNLMQLDNTPLKDIVNSQTFIKVRQDMLNGVKPIECEGCWKDEDAGLESKRQYENRRWKNVIPILEKDAILSKPNFRYIELRLGNLCNTACITCNSYSSSKWYRDEKALAKELSWFKLRPLENYKWFEDYNFYKEVFKYTKDIKEIYINGGEPTLIKEHFILLQRLVNSKQSRNVHLVYSLNLSNLQNDFLKLLKNFKKVTINCSIDDLEDRNFYIRWPTSWETITTNLEKLKGLVNVEWHVTQTVSILNIDNLHNFRRWMNETYGKEPVHNYVLYPDYLSLEVLPESYKNKLINFYKDLLNDEQYFSLKGKLEIQHKPDLLVKTKKFLETLDKSRNLNYKHYLPHLNDFL